MSTLLPFHKTIIENIVDPATSDLVVMARGLGMRRIITTLMKIYDSPKNLVILVNATTEEESVIGEELGIIGVRKPGLRVITYETKDRKTLYRQGGLFSITPVILTIDMLTDDIPRELITGIIILHAEKATATRPEAFVARLYRERNVKGFIKAFTDQPEHITSGLSPLKNILKELQIRTVHIYPRFHADIKKSLERRRADVIELSQDLTEAMADIHHAIIQCMTTTLSEIKRSNTNLDLDDLNVENAYFRSFDIVVRRQLDPNWHQVGPRTKQLVNDLGTLRGLLNYLLTYDAFDFHEYLESLIAANTVTVTGGVKQHQSPWMLTDAANIIFQSAQRRCYLVTATQPERQVVDLTEDDDAWAALDEAEGFVPANRRTSDEDAEQAQKKPSWVPPGLHPVLEELPKWTLLAQIIHEAEGEMIRQENALKPGAKSPPGSSDVILVMTSSLRSCHQLTDFLSSMNSKTQPGEQGRCMMLKRMRRYLVWKARMAEAMEEKKQQKQQPYAYGKAGTTGTSTRDEEISDALKKKDREKAARALNRRRVRGGAPASVVKSEPVAVSLSDPVPEGDAFTQFLQTQSGGLDGFPLVLDDAPLLDFTSGTLESDFDVNFGLVTPEQTVIVRSYSDDTDDRVLAEIKPKFVVMVEPNMDFVRRIEVYRSTHPGHALRVYHMVYSNSCEEHKYLAGIRKEKQSFERLIKERGSMLLTLQEDRRAGSSDAVLKTISSRIAGGQRTVSTEPSTIIVDTREFRSALPSLIHAANILPEAVQLTVGDYVLTPDICVERKSLPDLMSSFNSGRLYTQCEMMCAHYKYPILLIEFEEDKAFTLDTVGEIKMYGKAAGAKYPTKKAGGPNEQEKSSLPTVQAKIVLLTLSFPKLRIIWASSPYATTEIFKDLKKNNPEPNRDIAAAIGTTDGAQLGDINVEAESVLRCIPGVSDKNIRAVMSRVKNLRELCALSLIQVQNILGKDDGQKCFEFIHKGDRAIKTGPPR